MKRRVAIVGGGMSGLTAAFELTRTEALRNQFEVTVYQMGWRLGGKAASGRLPDGRIVEHGLHIWFGCYENAFELVRAAYRDWKPQMGQAIVDPDAAFEEQRLTVIGSGDCPRFFGIAWPRGGEGKPGEGGPQLALWPCIRQLLRVIDHQYHESKPQCIDPSELRIPRDIDALMAEAGVKVETGFAEEPQRTLGRPVRFADGLAGTAAWADTFATHLRLRNEAQLRGFVRFLRLVSSRLWSDKQFNDQLDSPFVSELIDVGMALVTGVIVDIVLGGASIAELDALDFREWLSSNGAHRESAYGSNIVQSLYDTTFQYCGGDKRRPSFGAGSAAQSSLRLFGGYRDAFAYEPRAGLGETVIAPLHGVLCDRGVRFAFFHKLTRLELNGAKDGVAQIHFDQQVDLLDGTYGPTIPPHAKFGNLECWPAAPLWGQIKDGDALEREGLDLESSWCDYSTRPVTLRQGQEFDDVVLAIPVGAFIPRGTASGPCAELIAASPRFKKMTDAASLSPNISVQAWCTLTLAELGWPPAKLRGGKSGLEDYPTCTGPSPLDIWADRTAVLAYENWSATYPPPASLQYLCDVFETSLYKAPPSRVGAPYSAKEKADLLALGWFKEKSRVIWPRASDLGPFDWNVLFDPEDRQGEDRLGYQIVNANVDPWACCAGSPAGSTQWRLKTGRSGFSNLFLAGAWIDTGFNVECIEAAVMSGKQAARAIAGTDAVIDGEDFLHFERGLSGFVRELLIGAEALAEWTLAITLGSAGPSLRRRAFGRRR